MHTATETSDLMNLTLCDWEGSRKAHLEKVPRSATVGQVVSEAVNHLGLPPQHLYQAVLRGRELDPASVLDDLGVDHDAEIDLVPEVSAGCEVVAR
ncbi:MAG: hypothetical protein JRH01_17155 [Deltaproteobacteria bacterium]|nr:hypothetical protein [Deltaproteobacteria bacterium]MBW2392840.1 hypothetical protein [Deltaproteobacteria bacterium]